MAFSINAAIEAGAHHAEQNHLNLCRQSGNDANADRLIAERTQERIERLRAMPKEELIDYVGEIGIRAVADWNDEVVGVIKELIK